MSREILFYSEFPVGYHNREAEEKMAAFAGRGYDVHYVEQLGIRNPRPRHLLRIARTLLRSGDGPRGLPFHVVAPKLLPLRGVPGIDALNRRWLARQLQARLRDPARAVLWIRFPTPELVPFVEHTRRALVVYEVVEYHESSPGMSDRLRRRFRAAERRVLGAADLVFAWSEPMRDRLAREHPKVQLAGATVNLGRFGGHSRQRDPRRVAYIGALNFRFDAELVGSVAGRLPDWRFDLAGPVDREIEQLLERRPNISLRGPLPFEEVPDFLASAAVCVMPYREETIERGAFPVKVLEYLAAGKPVVGVPIPTLDTFSDLVTVAKGPEAFAAAIERAAALDSPEARQSRLASAAVFSLDRRIDEMRSAIETAIADR